MRQEIAGGARGAGEAAAQQGAIENVRRMGHGPYMRLLAAREKLRAQQSSRAGAGYDGAMSLLASGLGAIRRAGVLALDLLYPPACLSCRRAIAAHGGLCPDCWRAMRFIERPYCERLGTPFESAFLAGAVSPEAQADPPVFNRLRAVACFEDGADPHAGPSAEIWRPPRTRRADGAMDGAGGRGLAR